MEPKLVDRDGGSTTETDSDAENAACAANRSSAVKRERPAAVGSAALPRSKPGPNSERVPTPPVETLPWISTNSILAVPPGPPVPPSVEPVEMLDNMPERAPAEHTASPSARSRLTPAQDEDAQYCGLCTLKFTFKGLSKSRRKNADDMLPCICCGRDGLVDRHFSKAQRHKPAHEQRCLTCAPGGDEALKIIRGQSKFTREQLIAKNKEAIKQKLEASAKRKEKLAKTRLEKQQREAARALSGHESEEEEPKEVPDPGEEMQRMERALRDILQDYRSIDRRRGVNDLDGPYREEYELKLLEEESKLHEKAVQLRLENAPLYDEVCNKLAVIDGKVKLGERDHEQGEFDGDKPNHRLTKNGKVKIIKRKPSGSGNMSGEALLLAAKATADSILAARGAHKSTEEPSAKRIKRTGTDGVAWMVLNRQPRRASRPSSYVIDNEN